MSGQDMVDADGVFTQFYEHLRLPDYFGWNWDALRDCLHDFHWLPAAHILLTIDAAESILQEMNDERRSFYRMLSGAAKYWAAKADLPGQDKVTFRTVLLCDPGMEAALRAQMPD
ncbi:barstar family protein [Streptomyces sp. TRM S81-3]|uniref:Barstar family protein n=2 Tax=Streptomyces griseicoloratus TaxID=2752516 RepID=A0A926LA61_9ACTN|nr:barstar family protein [Streptomyces griseicoloratus]